jgi:hypothetical protein
MMRTPLFNASLRPKLTLQAMGLGLLLTVFGNAVTADDFAALKDLQDSRVVLDRLHPENNAHGEDFKELNAIGVLAAVDQASSTVYGFGSGALIDGCHVLTAQHVIYGGQGDFDTPPPAPSLEFLVGQVTPEEHNLTEGLRYVRFATATAMGGTGQHDGRSDSAERDWAVVTLTENLPEIVPIELHAFDPALRNGANWILEHADRAGIAGFPGDHMAQNPLVAHAHLWGSFGEVLGIYNDSDSGFAYFTLTAPATQGTSGGVAFTTLAGRHVAVGIIQSRSGDGIHDLIRSPTSVVLITPHLLNAIHDAMAAQPCRPNSAIGGGHDRS